MEINKLNIYKSVALSNNNLGGNNEKVTLNHRSSKDTNRGSTGEVVWKRKYKVSLICGLDFRIFL